MNAEMLNMRLRKATGADAEMVFLWRNQASSRRFQASPDRSVVDLRTLLDEQSRVAIGPNAVGKFYWVIDVDGGLQGWVQLDVSVGYRQQGTSTLGYAVAESAQGRGVATGAVRAAVELAFGRAGFGLERIEAVAAVENIASRRVLEKVGFQFEGIRRGLLRIQGERVDHACYGLLVTDSRTAGR